MESLLLISNQVTLLQAVAKMLPENWTLLRVDQFSQLQRYLEKSPQPGQDRYTILIDIEAQPEWTRQLTDAKWDNVLIYGLIDDPGQQEAAFRAGANDYLLKPWLASEINGRLARRLKEREIIQRLSNQVIQKERQASIGRLTSYICHDINNAMQATGGALDLALEESDGSSELDSYLTICRQETRRVVKLLERVRQIYRPQVTEPESIHPDILLLDVLTMVSDEMSANDISVDGEIPSSLPAIRGVPNQLYAAFLSILLNLCDAVGNAGGGTLQYLLHDEKQFIEVEFTGTVKSPSTDGGSGINALVSILDELDSIMTMEPARNLIIANNGEINICKETHELSIRMKFPVLVE